MWDVISYCKIWASTSIASRINSACDIAWGRVLTGLLIISFTWTQLKFRWIYFVIPYLSWSNEYRNTLGMLNGPSSIGERCLAVSAAWLKGEAYCSSSGQHSHTIISYHRHRHRLEGSLGYSSGSAPPLDPMAKIKLSTCLIECRISLPPIHSLMTAGTKSKVTDIHMPYT